MLSNRRHPARAPLPRAAGAGWALAGAVLLHLLVLGGWPESARPDPPSRSAEPRPLGAPTVRVRQLPLPAASTTGLSQADTAKVPDAAERSATAEPPDAAERSHAAAVPEAAQAPPAATAQVPRLAGPAVAQAGPARPAGPAAAAGLAGLPGPAGGSSFTGEPHAPPSAVAGEGAVAPPAGPASDPPPLYATRLPPPVTLRYALQRDGFSDTAWLSWLPQADARYELSLQMESDGDRSRGPPTAWRSGGLIDFAGLAPVRYAEWRGGRERRVANFQRQARRISFSASTAVWPLADGVQDRLSWMLQLGAVLAANPDLGKPGAQVVLQVVGTRGEAQLWRFSPGADAEPDGTGALHLRREPAHLHDLQVDAWLDPAMHHLPVRVRLLQRGTRRVLELRLAPQDPPALPPAEPLAGPRLPAAPAVAAPADLAAPHSGG